MKERRKSRRGIHFRIEPLHSFLSFTKIDHYQQAVFSRGKQVNKKKILSVFAINDTCLCAQIFCLWEQSRFSPPSAVIGKILQYFLMLPPHGSRVQLGVDWGYG